MGILWLKPHYFSQFMTKMGFCCKILSLNDLTPTRTWNKKNDLAICRYIYIYIISMPSVLHCFRPLCLPRVRSVDWEPIGCLQWQRANARANLWWRHEPFPGETLTGIALCWKSGGRKKVLVMLGPGCLGIIPSKRCCRFGMISQILE